MLSDQLILAGQVGLNINTADLQTLFVHKNTMAKILTCITRKQVTINKIEVDDFSDSASSSCESESDASPFSGYSSDFCMSEEGEEGEIDQGSIWENSNDEPVIQMDIHRISTDHNTASELDEQLSKEDDGGVGEILNKNSSTCNLTGAEFETLNKVKSCLRNNKISEDELIHQFRDIDIHQLMICNDNVVHHSDGPDIDNESELDGEIVCCNLQCSELEKFMEQERELNLKVL